MTEQYHKHLDLMVHTEIMGGDLSMEALVPEYSRSDEAANAVAVTMFTYGWSESGNTVGPRRLWESTFTKGDVRFTQEAWLRPVAICCAALLAYRSEYLRPRPTDAEYRRALNVQESSTKPTNPLNNLIPTCDELG